LVKHLTRDHNTNDSKEIVYQNKKKDNEKLVPTTVDETEEQNSLADLQQLENDVEMKGTEEEREQPQTTFSLVATDEIPEGSEVVQLQGIVEEDDEQTMEKESEQQIVENQIVENQIAVQNHQIVTEAQINVAEHQMSQIPQDQIPQNQIQVSEMDENDANIHVTAILTSSLEEKPIIKDIQVKDEGTQIT